MTRRLVLLIGGFVVVMVCLAVSGLVQSFAAERTQDLALARQVDMSRFASLAGRAFDNGDWDTVDQELASYHQVYQAHVSVLDNEFRVLATTRTGSDDVGAATRTAAERAVQGVDPEPVSPVYPWTSGSFVSAIPVGTDSQTVGAVVTTSPLDQVRTDVGKRLALLSGGGLLVILTVLALLSLPLAFWVLRPVHALERHAALVASGALDEPVPHDQVVPEIRSLAWSFDTMLTSVKRLLSSQQQFADDAAHQLRNPLTALRLNLETLATATAATTPEGRRARAALLEVERLGGIADGLLDLSRATARAEPARSLDATAVVEGVAVRWHDALPGLQHEIEPGLVVHAAPGELEQVLDILLDNAAKYAPGAEVHVSARVSDPLPHSASRLPRAAGEVAGADGPGVLVVVADNGAGVQPEHLTQVGSRFWRAPGTQNRPGAGLGLSIARRLLDRAGGQVAWSVDAPGFEVSTWWPSTPDASPSWLAQPVSPRATPSAGAPG